jgi:hypothetical protein
LQDEGFPNTLGNDFSTSAVHCKLVLMDLLRDIKAYLVADSPFESLAERRLAAKRDSAAFKDLLLAELSLSGGSHMSFQAAMRVAQRQDPAAAPLKRCYRC